MDLSIDFIDLHCAEHLNEKRADMKLDRVQMKRGGAIKSEDYNAMIYCASEATQKDVSLCET